MRGVPAMDVMRPNADELKFTSGKSWTLVLIRVCPWYHVGIVERAGIRLPAV